MAMHTQDVTFTPLEFSRRMINAIKVSEAKIRQLVGDEADQEDRIDSRKCLRKVTDEYAEEILALWKEDFPDTFILPVVGFPSKNGIGKKKNKVAVYTHTLGDGMLLMINGLASKSPVSNNALYSFECTRGQYLHFYEIMLPDLAGSGDKCVDDEYPYQSTVQIYVNTLAKNGLDVSGIHWHNWGSELYVNDCGVFAIHHQNIGMTPEDFYEATTNALNLTIKVINQRSVGMMTNNKSTKMIKSTKQIKSNKSDPHEIHDHEFDY